MKVIGTELTWWCRHWSRKWLGAVRQQAHHLNQCLPSSVLSYGVTRPQWVKDWTYWYEKVSSGEISLKVMLVKVQKRMSSSIYKIYSSINLFELHVHDLIHFCVPIWYDPNALSSEHQQVWGGGYWANFLRSVIFPIFPNDQNSGNLYDIKFIFGRCHRSWAAETSGKCEHDWNYLNYTFAKSTFSVTEKLANGALATPTPDIYNVW